MDAALHGTDRPVAMQPVSYFHWAKKPPERLRVHSEILIPEAPPAPQKLPWPTRLTGGAVAFLNWLLDPLQWIGDWFEGLFRTRKQRIRDKHLKGGWESTAGELMRHNFVSGHRVLVIGENSLSLVYLGRSNSAVAWSVPLPEFKGVEHATWRTTNDHMATLRCHFADGSWADVVAKGPGWCEFLDKAPMV